jgi:hypothetical protein
MEQEAEKSIHLNELELRKPLVVSISRKSETAETIQVGLELSNFKLRLKAVSSNASPGFTVRFLRATIGVF